MNDEGMARRACVASLASLPGMGNARLLALLDRYEPLDAWAAVCAGRGLAMGDDTPAARRLTATWRAAAGAHSPEVTADALSAARVDVLVRGDAAYPAALDDDPEPPAVLFARGRLDILASRRVAIVGTRRCTHYGRDVARQLGRELCDLGVAVVSGLALGIDGAAHEGALAVARPAPIGVVGSGLDVVYPRRHERLWHHVASSGLLLSEAPLGAAPEPWRFPERNRIIAGLAEVVVVVESRRAGGSMHTVRAAIDRGLPVMAVPGSVRSAASEGTNQLLSDGAAPVTDVSDITMALGLVRPEARAVRSSGSQAIDPADAPVLEAVEWTPTPTEDVLRRTGLEATAALAVLTRLEIAGAVRSGGGWWERLTPDA